MIREKFHEFSSFEALNGKLGQLRVQRSVMNAHVEEIKNYIHEQHLNGAPIILGCLDLGFLDNRYYVIDGQHRLQAIEKLYLERNLRFKIKAIVYTVDSVDDLRNIFFIRNRNVPPADFIVDEDLSDDKSKLINSIKSILEGLGETRGFTSELRNRPFINIEQFLDKLYRSKIFELIQTPQDFNLIFSFLNSKNRSFFQDPAHIGKYGVSPNMLERAEKLNNYLSLMKFKEFEERYDTSELQRFLHSFRTCDLSFE